MDISTADLDHSQNGPVALTREVMRSAAMTVVTRISDQTLARQILDSLGILGPLREEPLTKEEKERSRNLSRRPARNYPVSATRRY